MESVASVPDGETLCCFSAGRAHRKERQTEGEHRKATLFVLCDRFRKYYLFLIQNHPAVVANTAQQTASILYPLREAEKSERFQVFCTHTPDIVWGTMDRFGLDTAGIDHGTFQSV